MTAASLGDAARPFSAAALAALVPAGTRLLALGEPTHGAEEFLDLRNELFRHLVTAHGYRSIAVESDCLAARTVDAYVRGADGELDAVLREGFGHGFGEYAGNRELVRWIREFNAGAAPGEQVGFYGADGPLEYTGAAAPGPALLRLHAFLADRLPAELLPERSELLRLHGPDDRWTEPAAALDPTRSIGRTEDAVRLRLLADGLGLLLAAHRPQFHEEEDALWQAELDARTATGLLRYHAATAGGGPDRLNSLMRQRDLMMADNVEAILHREARRGPTLLFAHNRHLQREAARIPLGAHLLQWWSAGSLLASRLGDGYAFLATTFGHRAPDDHPAPDTLEGLLATLPSPRSVLDPKQLAAAVREPGRVKARVPADHTYFGLDPEELGQLDGVVFIREIARQQGLFGGRSGKEDA
ncbi:erythromycin esterase family protein [Kitasatospora sp. NA04385]|uniref:erythromycin esterase family protein n=1 Tax=Kitasatospora sp. NA04385 TaxID=2742135 RepID=UPI001590E46C|nr:erythromycin esterase family protein [Kitasatospora sp. NA04385]QKW18708.1 erythromycin esterase family protein [Kitasatospora sp. NA04385]